MENKLFQVPGYIKKIETKTSGSLKFTGETQENLTPMEKQRLFDYQNKYGWLCFLPAEEMIDPLDINLDPLPKIHKKDKSLSERLRNVLYVFYKQTEETWQEKGFKTADDYYKYKMELLIDTIKERLVDED